MITIKFHNIVSSGSWFRLTRRNNNHGMKYYLANDRSLVITLILSFKLPTIHYHIMAPPMRPCIKPYIGSTIMLLDCLFNSLFRQLKTWKLLNTDPMRWRHMHSSQRVSKAEIVHMSWHHQRILIKYCLCYFVIHSTDVSMAETTYICFIMET